MFDRITFSLLLAVIVLLMPLEWAIGWAFPPRPRGCHTRI
jgi:hypothetical protein